MIKFENECVGCPKEMGCLGSGCPYTHIPHLECDKCGDDVEKLYDTEEGQLCEECAGDDREEYDIITEDNASDYSEPYEDEDEWDYADLAYEQKCDERYMENEG